MLHFNLRVNSTLHLLIYFYEIQILSIFGKYVHEDCAYYLWHRKEDETHGNKCSVQTMGVEFSSQLELELNVTHTDRFNCTSGLFRHTV